MKTSRLKRALKWTAVTLCLLIAAVVVHIYLVTRPRVDATTRIMARVDMHAPLSQRQADTVTAWLYRQAGIDHVLCNARTGIVIFTYSPLKANADHIAARLSTSLHYPAATRYVPTEKQLKGGCPVASTSVVYKTYAFFKTHL